MFAYSHLIRISVCVIALLIAPVTMAVEYVSDERRVQYNGIVEDTPDSPFADFDVPNQTSQLRTDGFSAFGSSSGSGTINAGGTFVDSYFEISFVVDLPTHMDFSGLANVDRGTSNGFAFIKIELFASDLDNFSRAYAYEYRGPEPLVIEEFGFERELVPGLYRLILTSVSRPNNSEPRANWSIEANFSPFVSVDSDGDLTADHLDNCLGLFNLGQVDRDGDGFGNRCDGDLNNDCAINVVDLGILRTEFHTTDSPADFNGDGVVSVQDLGILRTWFHGRPGPSALTSCDISGANRRSNFGDFAVEP